MPTMYLHQPLIIYVTFKIATKKTVFTAFTVSQKNLWKSLWEKVTIDFEFWKPYELPEMT